jgi:HSP20 family protein
MVDIIRRKSDSPSTPSLFDELEPFAGLRQLLRWGNAGFDPFRTMIPVFEASAQLPTYMPSFEVKETKDAYVFKADVPGVKDEDLKVTIAGNRLSVSGKRDEEKKTQDETYYCYERNYGSFSRTFTLPDGADVEQIKAEMKSGQLAISVPKKAAQIVKEIKVHNDK